MPATPHETVTDEVLMMRFQSGDSSALAHLVRRHKTSLYNVVLRQIRHASTAEDIVQEVFVRVVQKASDFKHEAKFSTWVYTIARNLCVDNLRKMSLRRHPSLDQPSSAAADSQETLGERLADSGPNASIERVAMRTDIAQRITQAVEELPPDQREVFLLREVANLPFAAIAEVIGAPENTIKSRMRYALERLQAALSDYEEYARALR